MRQGGVWGARNRLLTHRDGAPTWPRPLHRLLGSGWGVEGEVPAARPPPAARVPGPSGLSSHFVPFPFSAAPARPGPARPGPAHLPSAGAARLPRARNKGGGGRAAAASAPAPPRRPGPGRVPARAPEGSPPRPRAHSPQGRRPGRGPGRGQTPRAPARLSQRHPCRLSGCPSARPLGREREDTWWEREGPAAS